MSTQVKVKKAFVNSKPLFNDINEFVEQAIAEAGVVWSVETQRNALREIIEDWLNEFRQDGKITQFKIQVNTLKDDEYEYELVAKYKQKHCLNSTVITYLIKSEEIDDLLEWIMY